jgi:hypothetical protein
MKAMQISNYIKPEAFLRQTVQATTVKAITTLLAQLPIVSENEYAFDAANPAKGWVGAMRAESSWRRAQKGPSQSAPSIPWKRSLR